MSIRQYVNFRIWSEALHPRELTALLGVEPDIVKVKGARHGGPKPVPRFHVWAVGWTDVPEGISLDEQLRLIEARLRPLETALSQLGTDPGNHLNLCLVRRFVGELTTDALGLGFEPSLVELLARLGAGIDVDEYPYDSRVQG